MNVINFIVENKNIAKIKNIYLNFYEYDVKYHE